MKQIKILFFTLAVALMGISLTACGDDNNEPSGGSIVGTWEGDYLHWFDSANGQDGFFDSSKGYIKFNDDNTYISVSDIVYTDEWVEIYGAQKHEVEIERGTYKISGNTITLKDSQQTYSPVTFSVKGNKLTIVTLGFTFTFTRVSDSVINKYLN